jgi:hypothetical protein
MALSLVPTEAQAPLVDEGRFIDTLVFPDPTKKRAVLVPINNDALHILLNNTNDAFAALYKRWQDYRDQQKRWKKQHDSFVMWKMLFKNTNQTQNAAQLPFMIGIPIHAGNG